MMKLLYLVFCFVFLRTYVGILFLLQFNVINNVFLRTYVGILLFKDICLIFSDFLLLTSCFKGVPTALHLLF